MRCNVYEEQLQSADLFGKPVLYTEKQVQREAVPEGWHCYDLCGGERQPARPTELVNCWLAKTGRKGRQNKIGGTQTEGEEKEREANWRRKWGGKGENRRE